jgi:hypothetical protein
MELKITTILPADDKDLAVGLLNSLIYEQFIVPGIVVGTDEWCFDVIQKTDRVAYARKNIRRSVWVRNPDMVREILDTLFSHSEKFDKPAELPYLFTLSLGDTVCDLILPGDTPPDHVRIDKAFRQAEIG